MGSKNILGLRSYENYRSTNKKVEDVVVSQGVAAPRWTKPRNLAEYCHYSRKLFQSNHEVM